MNKSTSHNRKSPESSRTHAVAGTSVVSLSSAARSPANNDPVTTAPQHQVNPLWMITVALAIIFGGMAALLLAS